MRGNVRVEDDYLRISPTGDFQSVQEIGDLLISSDERRLVYLRDIATITRAYDEVPTKIYYVNGEPGLSIGISMLGGENVVEVGNRLGRQAGGAACPSFPVGMDLKVVYNQPREVDNSVNGFIVSVGQAVAIVIGVLLLFMGLRTGIIIGAVLLITVAGTLFIMDLFAIELQRISLGALVYRAGYAGGQRHRGGGGHAGANERGHERGAGRGGGRGQDHLGAAGRHRHRYPRLFGHRPVAGQYRGICQQPVLRDPDLPVTELA